MYVCMYVGGGPLEAKGGMLRSAISCTRSLWKHRGGCFTPPCFLYQGASGSKGGMLHTAMFSAQGSGYKQSITASKRAIL